MNKVNKYIVTYTVIREYSFTDEDMQNFNYGNEITESMREEFLNNLLEENILPFAYDDIEIQKI